MKRPKWPLRQASWFPSPAPSAQGAGGRLLKLESARLPVPHSRSSAQRSPSEGDQKRDQKPPKVTKYGQCQSVRGGTLASWKPRKLADFSGECREALRAPSPSVVLGSSPGTPASSRPE